MSRIARDHWRTLFWIWCGLGVGCLLPAGLLHTLDSFLKYDSLSEIGLLFAVLAVVYLVAAALAATLVVGVQTLFRALLPRSRIPPTAVLLIAVLVPLLGGSLALAYLLRIWISGFGAPLAPAPSVALAGALAAVACLFFARSVRLHGALAATGACARLGRRLAMLGLVLPLGVVAAGVLTGDRPRARPDAAPRPPAAVDAAASARRPDIFLITIDTLSASHLPFHGYHRQTAPALTRFAQTASVFDNFYANANFTTPAVTSLMTGLQPWHHEVYQLQSFVRGDTRSFAGALTRAGYATAAFTMNPAASPRQNRTAADYDHVADDCSHYLRHRIYTALTVSNRLDLQNLTNVFPWVQALGLLDRWYRDLYPDSYRQDPACVFSQALDYVDARAGRAPLFVWTHIWPPHHYYLPPAPFLYRFNAARELDTFGLQDALPRDYPPEQQPLVDLARDRYDENLLFADTRVGEYLEQLRRRGRFDNSVILVTADHGESFAKGYLGHGGPHLPEPMIHVPLLVRMPGQAAGRRIGDLAEQVDLAPTVLELAGVSSMARLDGRSLVPVLEGRRMAKPVFSSWLETNRSGVAWKSGLVSVRDGDWKWIASAGSVGSVGRLYNLRDDPGEDHDLAARNPAVVARLRATLRAAAPDRFAGP